MKLSDVVKKVIDLAQAKNDYWETELPKRHPDYPLVHPGEDSGPPPPEETQLREFLSSLPEDMLYQLLLVMHLGRSNAGPQDLAEYSEQLKEDFARPEWAISLMMEMAPLADYLNDGMEELRRKRIDVDKLLRKSTKMRK